MKKFLYTVLIILIVTCVSCADSINEIEKTYQRGIERAKSAQSPDELSQITIDVRNDLINGAKGIGGDRKLSETEMRRYYNAQREFEQAVENRHYQLTGNRGVWREVE